MSIERQYDVCLICMEADIAEADHVSRLLRSTGFHADVTSSDHDPTSFLRFSRIVGFWLSQHLITEQGQAFIANCLHQLPEGIVAFVIRAEPCQTPLLLKGRRMIDLSGANHQRIEPLIALVDKQASSQLDISLLEMNLRDAIVPEQAAYQLSLLVENNHDYEALQALWNPLHTAHKLHLIVDHCVWVIGQVLASTTNNDMVNQCLSYFEQSQETENELIIDTFAYSIGDVFLAARSRENTSLQTQAKKLIDSGLHHSNPLVQKSYRLTKNRLNRTLLPELHIGIYFDEETRRFYTDGQVIRDGYLTKTEYLLLQYLYASAGKMCSYDAIIAYVWNDAGTSNETVSTTIGYVRKKLNTVSINAGKYIVTIRGSRFQTGGYALHNPDAHERLV